MKEIYTIMNKFVNIVLIVCFIINGIANIVRCNAELASIEFALASILIHNLEI